MRPVHWARLPPAKLASTVWASIDSVTASLEVDVEATTALFAVSQPPSVQRGSSRGRSSSSSSFGGGASGGAAESSDAAAENGGGGGGGAPGFGRKRSSSAALANRGSAAPALRVISVQRANNVGIFLKRMQKLFSVERLCAGVTRLEAGVLEPELLEGIIANLPPEAEAKSLRALKNVTPEELAPAERFCYEMASMPRLRPMLHALRLKQTLPSLLERATTALSAVGTAARQLMGSGALVAILGSLLRHGNLLNAGTNRGGARGFKLEGIDKARSLKAANGKSTLLEHACAATGLSKAAFSSELGGVRKACALPLIDVIRILKEVQDGIEVVGAELALCPLPDLEADVAADAALLDANGGDGSRGGGSHEQQVSRRFREAMAPFYDGMCHGLTEVSARRDEAKALLRQLAGWLGEDPDAANPDAMLKTLADLIDTAVAVAPAVEEEEERE